MVSPIGRLLAACFGRRALLLDLPNQPFGTQNLPRKPIRHTLRLPNGSEVVLRGLIKKAQVRRARCRLLRELHGLGATKGQQSAQLSAQCLEGQVAMPSLLSRLDLQALPEVQAVLEHPALFQATASRLATVHSPACLEGLLETQEVVTTCYKWLRAVPPGAFTGPHMDRSYVGAGQRLTCWIPLQPVACGQRELGALCWVPGSQARKESFPESRAGADGERRSATGFKSRCFTNLEEMI